MPSVITSPRGHRAFEKLTIQDGSGNSIAITANSTALLLDDGLQLSDGSNTVDIGADANGLTVAGKVTFDSGNSGLSLSANTTGFIPETIAAEPSTDTAALFAMLADSTGNCLLVNSTGTTWSYVNYSSVRPTLGG